MKKRLKIKCCGITQYEQLIALQETDVDLVGHIYYPRSPRNLDSFQLTRFLKEELIKPQVLVTVDHDVQLLCDLVDRFEIPYVQLHGSESIGYCEELKRHSIIIKAMAIREPADFEKCTGYEGVVDYFLFDTKTPDLIGGTGFQWDWSLLDHYMGKTPFFISGGIKPSDLERILRLDYEQLYGVDINSRFELKPGVKDLDLVCDFVHKIKQG